MGGRYTNSFREDEVGRLDCIVSSLPRDIGIGLPNRILASREPPSYANTCSASYSASRSRASPMGSWSMMA